MTDFVGLDEIEISQNKEEIPDEKTTSAESYSQALCVPIRAGKFDEHDGNPGKAAGGLDG